MTRAIAILAVLILIGSTTSSGQNPWPQLVIEAPETLTVAAEQIQAFDPSRLNRIMAIIGLTDAGAPIRVLLVPEETALAKSTPTWVAAFADATRDLVVLLPERIGSYPHSSLETVLHHEVSHILTARAAAGRRIPRWFNEGLASAAERTWSVGIRSRFAWEFVLSKRLTPTEFEGLFEGRPRDITTAYVLSDRLVRDLLEQYGSDIPARIFSRMAEGAPFETALYVTTGNSVDRLMRTFWHRHSVWESWISVAGNPFTQWSLITLLAITAIWRHRRKRRARRQLWEMEESLEEQAWEEHRRRYRVH